MSIFVFIQMPRTDTVTEATEVQWQYWDKKLKSALKGAKSSIGTLLFKLLSLIDISSNKKIHDIARKYGVNF